MTAFWIALLILTAVTTALAWMTEVAPYDYYADCDRSQLDVWDETVEEEW